MKKLLFILIAAFASFSSFSQDIITLKTGDEIKSKVLEINTEQVKYKKWENKEGPIYSLNKSEVFMIKYENGTKDVFKMPTSTDSYLSNTNTPKKETGFLGTWVNASRANDPYRVHKLIITKNGEEYLINTETGIGLAGSGKEQKKMIGRLVGESIEVDIANKLSLIENGNVLLYNNAEFVKTGKSYNSSENAANYKNNVQQIQNSNRSNATTSSAKSSNKTPDTEDSTPAIFLTTTHKGFFFDKIPGESYFSKYMVNRDKTPQPSINKNLFYKQVDIVCWDSKFGSDKKYKNDELIAKNGDTLSLILNIGGDVIKVKSPLYSGVWIGSGEYVVSIQVCDSLGNELYKDSWERIVKTRNESIYVAKSYDEIIKISPDKLQTFPKLQDLYLSFFIQGKNKKQMLEGFLKFKVDN